MRYKDMHRTDWKRVLQRKYASRDISFRGTKGKESLLLIEKVSQPLTIDNVAGRVLIADSGISWLQIALEADHVWITVMYDQQDAFIQAYFDITGGNCFENNDNPTFEDMYLDVVLNKKLEIHILDRDELNEALATNAITLQQYAAACLHCENLVKYLQLNTDEFLRYCSKVYHELKPLLT